MIARTPSNPIRILIFRVYRHYCLKDYKHSICIRSLTISSDSALSKVRGNFHVSIIALFGGDVDIV